MHLFFNKGKQMEIIKLHHDDINTISEIFNEYNSHVINITKVFNYIFDELYIEYIHQYNKISLDANILVMLWRKPITKQAFYANVDVQIDGYYSYIPRCNKITTIPNSFIDDYGFSLSRMNKIKSLITVSTGIKDLIYLIGHLYNDITYNRILSLVNNVSFASSIQSDVVLNEKETNLFKFIKTNKQRPFDATNATI